MRKGFDNWLFRSTQSIGGVILLQNKRKHKRASLNLKETKQRRAKHLLIATKEEPFYDPGVEPNILSLSGCIEGPEPLLGGDEPAGPGAGPLKLGGPPAGGKGGIAPIVGGNGGGAPKPGGGIPIPGGGMPPFGGNGGAAPGGIEGGNPGAPGGKGGRGPPKPGGGPPNIGN